MRTLKALMLAVVIIAGPALADVPDGEIVMGKVSKVFREMRDLAADIQINVPRRQASGNIVLQYVKEPSEAPDRPERIVRKYITVTQIRTGDGPATIKQVNDGKYLWIERRIAGTGDVKVIRRRVKGEGPVPGGFGPDWRKEADRWRRKYTFRTLRTDTFDEEPVAVIEGLRKETREDTDAKRRRDISLPNRMVIFVSRRDYFPRKVELYSSKPRAGGTQKQETLTVSVRLMHVKLNKGLKPDTFHYVIPPGAEFVDVK